MLVTSWEKASFDNFASGAAKSMLESWEAKATRLLNVVISIKSQQA